MEGDSAGRRVKLNRYRSGLLVRSLVVIAETTSLVPTVDDARRVAEVLPGSVLLFGSVARGDATPGSDINVVVVLDDARRVETGCLIGLQSDLGDLGDEVVDCLVRVIVVDWPEWVSRQRIPGRVEHSAGSHGIWLKRHAPGSAVEWERVKSPREETTAWVIYALETAEAMLQWTSGDLSSPPVVKSVGVESGNEKWYWRSVGNKLFFIRSTLYVGVEQLVDGLNYLQGVPYETSPTLRLRLAFGDLSVQLRKYLGELEPPLDDEGLAWVRRWHTSTYRAALEMSTASEITQKLGFVTSDVAEYTRLLVPVAAGLAVYGAYMRSIAKAVERFVGEELGKGEASSIMLTPELEERLQDLSRDIEYVGDAFSTKQWLYADGAGPPNGWAIPPQEQSGGMRFDWWDKEFCTCHVSARCGLLEAGV